MFLQLVRNMILAIGWPILIWGSVEIMRQAIKFYKSTSQSVFARLILIANAGALISMYSLGIVATAFLLTTGLKVSVPIVLPLFLIWLATISVMIIKMRRWNEQAVAVSQAFLDLEKTVGRKTHELSDTLLLLERKIKELEEVKLATLNLLEDLDVERSALKETNAKLETFLSSIGDGLVVLNKDGKIILVNGTCENLLGWKASEILGKTPVELIQSQYEDGKPIPEKERPYSLVFSTKKIVTRRGHYFVRKDGTRFPLDITFAPMMRDGDFFGAVGVFRDISREKEIDRAKNEFVSLASHQLRNPTAAISWYTEFLLSGDAGKINKKQKLYLTTIYNSARTINNLIAAFLNVAKMELGTFALNNKPTNFGKVADEIISVFQAQIKKQKLDLKTEYDKNLPLINADATFLSIVLDNIISNAIKYTPSSGKITVSIKKIPKDVLIQVSDTGYGIPKDAQPKIFTKLFRAENIKEKYPFGTGLGLYMVKSVIDKTGGKIWFVSEENKGTNFYISWPLSGMKA